MASRPPPRTLQLLARQQVTPNLLRLTLGGPGLDGFPAGQAGGYVKLMIENGSAATKSGKPVIRTYTIRAQRPGEIDLDFVLHRTATGEAGPATEWAIAAQIGDEIKVGGPGAAKPLPAGHDFYAIAGDMTALPAMSVNLEALDRGAKGLAVIEIQHPEDEQAIDAPPGVDIRWLVNPQPGARPDLLVDTLRTADWSAHGSYAWAACEFQSMRALRDHLRGKLQLPSDRLYISSYWKSGLDEEAHKLAKREDAEQAG